MPNYDKLSPENKAFVGEAVYRAEEKVRFDLQYNQSPYTFDDYFHGTVRRELREKFSAPDELAALRQEFDRNDKHWNLPRFAHDVRSRDNPAPKRNQYLVSARPRPGSPNVA